MKKQYCHEYRKLGDLDSSYGLGNTPQEARENALYGQDNGDTSRDHNLGLGYWEGIEGYMEKIQIAKVIASNGEKTLVKYVEDWGMRDGKNWLYYNEYGPVMLINTADNTSFDEVFELVLDNSPAIENEDVYMAYGFNSQEEFDNADTSEIDLSKGYHYMSNAGGTSGIVWTGYYWNLQEYTGEKK